MAAALRPHVPTKFSHVSEKLQHVPAIAVAMPRRRSLRHCNVSVSASGSAAVCGGGRRSVNRRSNESQLMAEKLDQWIRGSVGEIVSNIGEAPFLVHIFSNGPLLKLEREEAIPEKWPSVQKRWQDGKTTPPDGIILVEELKDEKTPNRMDAENKTWGLVVQGKGMDCPSCYILNTCRVRSSGVFCTQFCLFKAKCFGDSVENQIKQFWLAR